MSAIADLVKRLSSAYEKDSTGNNYKMLQIPASEFEIIKTETENVKDSHFVDTAIGLSLDRIGALLKVFRGSGETDTSYRARIKSEVPNFVGGGTIDSIRTALANLIGIDKSKIIITEDFPTEPAHFVVEIDFSEETGGPQPAIEMEETIDKTRGAGISHDLEYTSTTVWDSAVVGQRWDEGHWGNI